MLRKDSQTAPFPHKFTFHRHRKLCVSKTCVACDSWYVVWWFQDPVKNLHICCERCRTALSKGYELGLKASGRYAYRRG